MNKQKSPPPNREIEIGNKIWNGDCYWTVVAIVRHAIGFTTPTGHEIIWYEKKYVTDLFNYQLKQSKV